MNAKPRVLVIDDDKIALKSVTKGLSDFYQVDTASNGEEGLAFAHDLVPDFILLDVEMPGLNGYQVCEQLRQQQATSATPILFLSGHDKLQEKIKGYEAGGDDFIVKPFDSAELIAKLLVLSRFKNQESSLSEKVKSATEVAMTALTGSSEMGQAMTFVEQSYVARNYESLAKAFLATTQHLNLNCTLMLMPSTGPLFFNPSGRVAPLEAELIQHIHGSKRFVDAGSRTFINYPAVVLLIKNMPVDNPVHYGRLKDLLPSMMGATDSRVKGIDTEIALRKQTRDLALGFQAVESTLRGMSDHLKREQQVVTDIMRRLLEDLEKRMPTMGLEDDQERFLVQRIDRAVEEATTVVNEGAKMGGAFETVLRLLEHINERQSSILTRIAEAENASNADDDRSSGAELF